MTVEDFLKKTLVGKKNKGYEIVEVEGFHPWISEDDMWYPDEQGVNIFCKVKIPDKRMKVGFRIDHKEFEITDEIYF